MNSAESGNSSSAPLEKKQQTLDNLNNGTDKLEDFEDKHVHEVYNAVAAHFSDTRYKPWPIVQQFIESQSFGNIGADVGCGNGKYLLTSKTCRGSDLFVIGSDRSEALVDICVSQRSLEAFVADGLHQPFRTGSVDFALSIAVIHHMSSPLRRKLAIEEILRILREGGRMLLYVWAFEQKGRRKFDKQDVFVPWHMPAERYDKNDKSKEDTKANDNKSLVQPYPASDAATFKKDETEIPAALPTSVHTNVDGKKELVFHRYYHLFVEGELEALVNEIPGTLIVDHGYDRDNWWAIVEKVKM